MRKNSTCVWPPFSLGLLLAALSLVLLSCGSPVATTKQGDSSRVAATTTPRDCAAEWRETRQRVRDSGQPDGEARRQADLARAKCEGIPAREHPKGANPPECAGDRQRKDAPPPADPAKVAVYFSCIHDIGTVGEPVYMHERTIGGGNRDVADKLSTAISEYLEGPAAQEADRGYISALGASFEGALESVSIEGQMATVSFSPQLEAAPPFASTAAQVLQAELGAITFQFDEINELILQTSGDCDRFWRMLESDCNVLKR